MTPHMRLGLALALVTVVFVPKVATADSMQVAVELGSVLGSETFCSLSYDQGAIQALIEQHVKADDMAFASTLNMMTTGTSIQNEEMSPSRKTAHCSQMSRVARAYGFIR